MNNSLTIDAGVTFDINTSTMGGALTNLLGSGTLKTQNTSAAPLPSGRTWPYNVYYNNLAGGQTIVGGTYSTSLFSSNTSGTNSLGADITVGGQLQVQNAVSGTGVLAIGAHTLTANGQVFGTLTSSPSSSITLGGSSDNDPLLLATDAGASSSLKNLTIGKGDLNLVSFTNPLDIYGTVSWTTSTGLLLLNSLPVVLKSNASGTASIGEVPEFDPGSFSLLGADNVTVERYIPAGQRSWRLLSTPATGLQTLRAAWANGTAPITSASQAAGQAPGKGTLITGYNFTSGGAAAAAGFDYIDLPGTVSSIRKYIVTATGGSFPGTPASGTPSLSTTLDNAEQGYMLFVRGDRTKLSGTPNATTLAVHGALKVGNTGAAMAGSATHIYEVLGNPYPSSVSFDRIMDNSGNSGLVLADRFWKWNAYSGTSGGYQVVKKIGGTWITVPPTAGSSFDQLQSSQAVLVQTTGNAGSLSITEGDKVVAAAGVPPVFTPASLSGLYSNLYLSSSDGQPVDGTLSVFGEGYSNTKPNNDEVRKIDGMAEGLSLLRNGSRYSIEAREPVAESEVLYLGLSNVLPRSYSFRFNALGMGSTLTATLKDMYLGTSTAIDLGGGSTTYDFSVTADAASSAATRFNIVFKGDPALPLSIASAKAYELGNGVQVEWRMVNEQKVRNYEVERSASGSSFTKSATVASKGVGTNAYGWYDAAPLKGSNYYRIKITGTDGKVSYSQVMLVTVGGTMQGFALYPNPAMDKNLSVQLNNLPKGRYSLSLYNNLGQVVLMQSVEHIGGSGTESVVMGKLLASGVYRVALTSDNGTSLNQTLVVE